MEGWDLPRSLRGSGSNGSSQQKGTFSGRWGPDLLLGGVKFEEGGSGGVSSALIPSHGSQSGKLVPNLSGPVDEGLGFGSPFSLLFSRGFALLCLCVFLLVSISLHLLILAAPLPEPGGACFLL